ncbi:MAG: class I SAM-dependent methyltransferase, partial [bacterium]
KVAFLLEAFSQARSGDRLKVLDVGCGVGLIHPFLATSVDELHAMDASEESLAIARRNNPTVQYRAHQGQRLPYADGTFDSAYAICVLHHVPVSQWQEFAKEMARVVRRGGRIVVIEHNPLNPATQWIVRGCEIDEDAVLVWPWRLRRVMASAGIQDLTLRYFLFTPFEHPVFRRLDRLFERLPLGAQYVASGRVA